jgi:hypothetical protein
MISDHPVAAGLVLLAVCLVVALVALQVLRVGTPVEQWARANGYKLISEHREASASVKIMGIPRQMRQVHRIIVRDAEGRKRSGRLEWTGEPQDPMHVRWED